MMNWILEEVDKKEAGQKIALQFPDQMLPQAKHYFFDLQQKYPAHKFFILADTSHNNCCVDEVAADHVQADLIIHFGDSCLTQPSKIRTLWFYGQESLCPELEGHLNTISQNTLLFYHIKYHDYFSNIAIKNSKVLLGEVILDSAKFDAKYSLYNRSFKEEIPNEYQVVWIGPDDCSTLCHILLCEQSKSTLITRWNLDKNQFDSENMNLKLFQRRIHFINQIRQFKTFVLLLSSITNKNTLEMIREVQIILDKHSKVHYSVIVGKLNPSKLMNFLEIDCFVWLGCSESPIIYDMKLYHEYHKPIVTPIELMLGFRDDPFSAPYVLDFGKFLEGNFTGPVEEECSKETSLTSLADRALVMTDRINARQFRGLRYEIDSGEENNLEIEQGRSGIAKGYLNEKQMTKN